MKKRKDFVVTEKIGVSAVRQYCNGNNLIFQGVPEEDYGVDCYLEVVQGVSPQNFIVSVQVKCGPSYRRDRADGTFGVSVSQDDLAYWAAANTPVVFVYVDATTDEIFWKHVQAELGGRGSAEPLTQFEFEPSDSRRSLAEYLRELPGRTPRTLDVVRMQEGDLSLEVDGVRHRVEPQAPDEFDFDAERTEAFLTSVVGYSRDERWLVLRQVIPSPAVGDQIYAVLRDTEAWAVSTLPVAVFEDGRPEGPGDAVKNLARAEAAHRAMAELDLVAPRHVLLRHEFAVPGLGDGTPPTVKAIWGDQEFAFEFVDAGRHRHLVLQSTIYGSGRLATVFTWEEIPCSFPGIDSSQVVVGVCEVALSPSAERISIAVITNPSHGCWGSPRVRHIHMTVEDLKRHCVAALLPVTV